MLLSLSRQAWLSVVSREILPSSQLGERFEVSAFLPKPLLHCDQSASSVFRRLRVGPPKPLPRFQPLSLHPLSSAKPLE
jgi:hypothetical protein